MGEGRHNSNSPSPFIWEKGLGDEGYQGNGTFAMLPFDFFAPTYLLEVQDSGLRAIERAS
jgi:hypothetical protein